MNKPLSLCQQLFASAMLLGISTAFAQTRVDLSGKVYDQDNKARPGVIVRLSSADLADTTDANGEWAIQGQMVSVKSSAKAGNLRWLGKELITQFEVPTLVSADLFDAAGRRLASFPARMLLPGLQSIPLVLPQSSGARWLRVQAGEKSVVLSANSGIEVPSIALPSGMARTAGIAENLLIYSLQGQIVTEDKLASLVQSGIMKWIQEHSISGSLIADPRVKVDSLWAWFSGGTMTSVRKTLIGYNKANNAYSGRIYTVKSMTGVEYTFNTWINIYGNGNRLTAVSDTTEFSTLFGALDFIRPFSIGNAMPDGVIAGADSVEAGTDLNLSLLLACLDTANHRVSEKLLRAEWDLADGKGWRNSSLPATSTARWEVPGVDTVKLRVMDIDSNTVVITKLVRVVNSGSALRLVGPADTTITPSDTLAFQLVVRDTSGVARVIWSYGDGAFDTTKTGAVHSVRHAYPGPSVVPVGSESIYAMWVTVIDSLGGSTTQKMSTVAVRNEMPTVVVTGLPTGKVNRPISFAAAVGPAAKRLSKVEWSFSGGTGTGNRAGATAKWLVDGIYKVKLAITDEDGNLAVDSSASIAIANAGSNVSVSSMVGLSPASPGTRDSIVTPNDDVTIALSVSDDDGVAKVLWDFGDGVIDSTKGVHTIKHAYPGAGVVPVGIAKRCTLSVKVFDTLGGITSIARVAVVKDTNDAPWIGSLPDTTRYVDSALQVVISAADFGKIARYEWSTNGSYFRGTLASDTIFRMPDSTNPNFRIYVRAVDEDGNTSKVDTVRVIVYGLFEDSLRDHQKYKYIKIGSQTWMAQNLNFQVDSSWLYNNSAANGAKYGRLYTWASAMVLNDTCNTKDCMAQVQSKHQGVCPSGWRIPDSADWAALENTVGGKAISADQLKSTYGWEKSAFHSTNTNGVDAYGFGAQPAGIGSANSFSSLGTVGYWWTSSKSWMGPLYSWGMVFQSGFTSGGGYGGYNKTSRQSMRCIQW